MAGWLWAVIVVAAIVVVAFVIWQTLTARRTKSLQGRFGEEYDRTVEGTGSKRDAEADLAARAERRDSFDIRPLGPGARERYAGEWERIQARFVDDPGSAVHEADGLIQSVMADRGYPVDDFDQRAADLSVDYPQVVENYREGHRLARGAERRDSFDIRPLAPGARERYAGEWERIQARFVDDPGSAVHEADGLIQSVMSDRGYPVDDFDQRAADLSVDYPQVVENYREGHRLARGAELGNGTTEELRRAMQHYRALFDDLLGETEDAPLSRDDASADRTESARR